jgi:hypothetical protein
MVFSYLVHQWSLPNVLGVRPKGRLGWIQLWWCVQHSGISLLVRVAGGGGSGSSGGPQGAMITSKEFFKFQADQGQLATQHIELYM